MEKNQTFLLHLEKKILGIGKKNQTILLLFQKKNFGFRKKKIKRFCYI
jgi:hypothetical protein